MEKVKVCRDITFYSKKNQKLVLLHSYDARKYADRLEEDSTVVSYRSCEPLLVSEFENVQSVGIRTRDFPRSGENEVQWESDFLVEFSDGHKGIRELVLNKKFTQAFIEHLELSRRYWQVQGIDDWKIVINERPEESVEGDEVNGNVFKA